MSEKRFELLDETIFDNQKQAEDGGRVTYWVVAYQQRQELVDLLNELNDENKTLKKENDDLRTTITKQVEAITEMKDLLYMFADLRIFDYSSEIEEDMQELKKAYGGTLEDFLNYFKED